MTVDSFINYVVIVGVVQGFLFNLITLFFGKKYGPVVLYLNLVVLFISLNNLQSWLPAMGYGSDHFFIKSMVVPWYLLIFPSFYNVFRHYLGVLPRTRNYMPFVLGLFLVEIVIRAMVVLMNSSLDSEALAVRVESYTVVEETVNICICIFIYLKAAQLVFIRRDWYPKVLTFDSIGWIKAFIILGLSIMLLWIFGLFLRATTGYNISVYHPLRLASTFLLYWIGYQGLYRYNIVQDRILIRKSLQEDSKRLPLRHTESNDRLYEKHLGEFNRVREDLVQNRRYLDPDLTLEKLAKEQLVSSGHLSRIINLYGNKSFNDFINELRVEQAKSFLSDSEYSPYTIVSIGLECGFNSKSTFYSAFKKFTSQTPSQYREAQAQG
ncbi:helix-turn-helix domain-containing protein [Robiginitalea sp.]|uniref:helix-turn-helix domain-containing protein n=1 Tax=Robiginitalea sp. TaxID=1902411 RepID=UPI003C71C039